MRPTSRLTFRLFLVIATAWMVSCGGLISNPAPVLTAISPTHISAGQPQFTLTVTGQQLSPSSIVEWKSAATGTIPLRSIFLSQSEMTAQIPASLIQNPGMASVVVFTPTPGGGTAAPLTFTIDPVGSPVPTITSINPTQTLAGGSGLTLFVSGTNFVSQSVVTVNNNNRPTNVINSTSLQAAIPSTDLGIAGTLQIAVVNPPPGGGASAPVPLSVTNPFPSIGTVSPASFQAGGASAALAVNGTGFVGASQIRINGSQATTAFVSNIQLTTQLTAANLAAGSINQVQVFNPGPGGGTSNTLTFAVTPTTSAGLPVLVDVAPDGTQANNGICGVTCIGGVPDLTTAGPSSSTTGRFVAFASQSNNLVANVANPASAIFLRDTCLGIVCTPTTFLVSVGASGQPANGPSSEPAIDNSASNAAYTSQATNLVTNVTLTGATRQVFWQPICKTIGGCVSTNPAQLVSVTPDGLSPGNAESFNPAMSSDGRYVAFTSLATNLVNGVTLDGVTPQVFLRDTCSGASSTTCTPMTFLVSSADGTTPGDGPSSHPAVALNGLFVSFTSTAKNLGATAPNPSGAQEIFVRATCVNSATTCKTATNLISAQDPSGTIPANGSSSESAITKDSRFIAFASTATNLGTNSGGVQQIYLRDTCTGAASGCTAATKLVSTGDGTTAGNALSEHPSITQNGQFVAFASLASNLGVTTTNGIENIFVRDTCAAVTTSCTTSTTVASHPAGTSPPPATGASAAPAVSGDGGTVSFLSFANNLVAHDTNGLPDIFLANAAPLETLSVTMLGTGSGTVTDTQGVINCTSTNGTATGTCSANFARGSSVTLTATPKSGSTFGGWSGGVTSAQCPATGACTVTVTTNITVDATFN